MSTANLERDEPQSDLWRVRYDGSDRVQLTHTPDSSEWHPQWSADGKWIAFLADRKLDGEAGDDDTKTQVWVMPADGGEAHRVTTLPNGVEDFVLSPDGKQLAVIAFDPEYPPGTKKPKNPLPIVTDRYQFKDDDTGYLGNRRKHLYLVDIASGAATQITSGEHDEQLPAWSPDGKLIAYVTKRGDDPDRHLNYDIYVIEPQAGAKERQLTTFPGSDLDPYWGTRPHGVRTARASPICKAARTSGSTTRRGSSPSSTSPAARPRCRRRSIAASTSRAGRRTDAVSTSLIEQSRVTHLSRIDLPSGKITELTHGDRFDTTSTCRRAAAWSYSAATTRILLAYPRSNETSCVCWTIKTPGWRASVWRPLKRCTCKAPTAPRSMRLLIKPVGYQPGQRYPTILRVHGGPVYQYSHEFMPDWQVYAAQGYAVVAVNPRGSSGRGFDFAKAIYADWGNKDVAGRARRCRSRGGAGHRRSRAPRHRRLELRRHPHQRRDRPRHALQGCHQRRRRSNMYAHVRPRPVRPRVRARARHALGQPRAYDRASYPFLHADRIKTPTLFQCARADFNVPCLGAEQMYQALRSLGRADRSW